MWRYIARYTRGGYVARSRYIGRERSILGALLRAT
jgi:hypothetical protein